MARAQRWPEISDGPRPDMIGAVESIGDRDRDCQAPARRLAMCDRQRLARPAPEGDPNAPGPNPDGVCAPALSPTEHRAVTARRGLEDSPSNPVLVLNSAMAARRDDLRLVLGLRFQVLRGRVSPSEPSIDGDEPRVECSQEADRLVVQHTPSRPDRLTTRHRDGARRTRPPSPGEAPATWAPRGSPPTAWHGGHPVLQPGPVDGHELRSSECSCAGAMYVTLGSDARRMESDVAVVSRVVSRAPPTRSTPEHSAEPWEALLCTPDITLTSSLRLTTI